MIELIYVVEGVNFAFARCAYGTRENAIEDTQHEQGTATVDNHGSGLHSITTLRWGNGNIATVTPMRLY